jgi:hypothetical protein
VSVLAVLGGVVLLGFVLYWWRREWTATFLRTRKAPEPGEDRIDRS